MNKKLIAQASMIKNTVKLVFKGFYWMGPKCLNEMFVQHQEVRDFHSDHRLLTDVSVNRTQFGDHNIRTRGGKYWNKLPHGL